MGVVYQATQQLPGAAAAASLSSAEIEKWSLAYC